MILATPFPELLIRLRAGNEDAARELVAAYEPFLRRTIRRRLARTPLQAVADSVDICQSVLGGLFVRLAAGEYELKSQEDLAKLLMGMVRKKLAALARRESADRRDRGRTVSLGSNPQIPAKPDSEPGRISINADLVNEVKKRLPESERKLFELRQQGHAWNDIAARIGGTAASLRKRLSRALREISLELGLE